MGCGCGGRKMRTTTPSVAMNRAPGSHVPVTNTAQVTHTPATRIVQSASLRRAQTMASPQAARRQV
ncbi:hypothetical protein ABIF78_007711 [Bradyrhizobium japonicum]